MRSASHARWQRLGELLVQRRIELAPRYRERTVFAAEHDLDWRLLHDIERGKRETFKPETLAAIEVAYQWQRGSIQAVLAGGDPAPVLPASSDGADAERWASFTQEERRIALAFIETLRRGAAERDRERNGGRESA